MTEGPAMAVESVGFLSKVVPHLHTDTPTSWSGYLLLSTYLLSEMVDSVLSFFWGELFAIVGD